MSKEGAADSGVKAQQQRRGEEEGEQQWEQQYTGVAETADVHSDSSPNLKSQQVMRLMQTIAIEVASNVAAVAKETGDSRLTTAAQKMDLLMKALEQMEDKVAAVSREVSTEISTEISHEVSKKEADKVRAEIEAETASRSIMAFNLHLQSTVQQRVS